MNKTFASALFAIILVVVLVIFFSYAVVSQSVGKFKVKNQAPFVVYGSFEVQDGPSSWDSTPAIDTHNFDTKFRWIIDDPNPDIITARLCVGTVANPNITGCNVVNYTFGGV